MTATQQQTLFADRRSIDERFAAFMRLHADVYERFVAMALDLRRRGIKRYSSDALLHVLRWERLTSSEKADGSAFRLSDHWSSRLARKAMAEYGELKDFFETRQLRSQAHAD